MNDLVIQEPVSPFIVLYAGPKQVASSHLPQAITTNRTTHGTRVSQGYEEKMERVRDSFFALA